MDPQLLSAQEKPLEMELFVFHRDQDTNHQCISGGAAGIVIDLESKGKWERQNGHDTEINFHSTQDIRDLKSAGSAYVICRCNAINSNSEIELNEIIAAGADEILIPMISTLDEVDFAKNIISNRCDISLMIETPQAIELLDALDNQSFKRFFVGLNDLRIARQEPSIFHPVQQGILNTIRSKVKHTSLGFGGLTLPGHGHPIPVELFMEEMHRLSIDFTFLRRSFYRDMEGKSFTEGIQQIKLAYDQMEVSNANSFYSKIDEIIGVNETV